MGLDETAGLDDAVLDTIHELADPHRRIEPLPGGLTNRNYRVRTTTGDYVVRLSSTDADLLAIDREHEYRNSLAAARAGVGAPVIAYRPEHHLLVVGYLDGVTLTVESFRQPGLIARAADACRRLHAGPRFVNDFDMFTIQRSYLDLVQQRGFRLPESYLDFEPQVRLVKAALAATAEPTVPCNNDLLAANFVDDGTRLWLIDYEYAGNNDACFELGNIWSECKLDSGQLEELLTCYYGKHLRNKLARAQLQGLMSRYGWTLWASIQQATSTLDFDFWSWGMQKYDAAVETFRGPDFDRLLADVKRPD